MALFIRDVVKASSSSEFRNDIQLAHYWTEHNLELVKGYIFTRNAAAGKKSAIDLLKLLCDAYTPGRNPNRFVFIATYGHGKSHFALALANFFGQPSDSLESEAILFRIKHAINDQGFAGYFDTFKRNHAPFLVLILSGTDPQDLTTQFFHSVEAALQQRSGGDQIELPFWYKGAESFLDRIDGVGRRTADEFLGQRSLDLDTLVDRVRRQDASSYDACRELHQHLYGTIPNFGASLSLKDGVAWISDHLCGPGKAYGGLLILFDEFSAFVRDYALRMNTLPGTPLQDLLDGVDSRREKTAFVAFSQHDPETVARNTLPDTQRLSSLQIQLNRLPTAQRLHLHSSLEEVLDAYLRQDNVSWKQLQRDSGFFSAICEASDLAHALFADRYERALNWSTEHFQKLVAQGAFPLHPMTTALLCTVDLQETANPRSVLGFVLKSLDELREQPASHGGIPTWIFPTALVDYFRDMLGAGDWHDYVDALKQAGGPDSSSDEQAVLKAMLLQIAAHVSTRRIGYPLAIRHFAGLPRRQEAEGALQRLAQRSVIRHDATQNLYMFWPAGRGANVVEGLLARRLAGKVLDAPMLPKLEQLLRTQDLLKSVPVQVRWGHSEDWKADQLLCVHDVLNPLWLRDRIVEHLVWRCDGVERSRGLVIWLLAHTPDAVVSYRESAGTLLQVAAALNAAPVVLMRPRTPRPDFIRLLLRAYVLDQFGNQEKAEAGQDQYKAVVELNFQQIKNEWKQIEREAEREVATEFRGRLLAVNPTTLDRLLEEVYAMAYAEGPKRWFTQYKISQTTLRSAVNLVIRHLIDNSLDVPHALSQQTVAKEIVEQFLRSEWGIVGGDSRIKSPREGAKVYSVWQALDEHFAPRKGSIRVKAMLEKLLNAPYGFDPYTVMLVFAAWFGHYRHDLEVSHSGSLTTLGRLFENAKSPKDMLGLLNEAAIKRRDVDEMKEKVARLIRRLDSDTLSQQEATESIVLLEEYVHRGTREFADEAVGSIEKIKAALDQAIRYDKQAQKLLQSSESENNLSKLYADLIGVGMLPMLARVAASQPSADVIQKRLVDRIAIVVKEECARHEQLKNISEFSLKQKHLQGIFSLLEKAGLGELQTKAKAALTQLESSRKALEAKEAEKATIARIEALPARGALCEMGKTLAEIQSLDLQSEEAKRAANKKITSISSAMQGLRDLARALTTRVSTVTTRANLRALQNELHRIASAFAGSEEEAAISAAIQRCAELEQSFEEQERAERDLEAQDAPHVAVMRAFHVPGAALTLLREQLQGFKGFNLQTERAIALRIQKLLDLNNEIDKLVSVSQTLLKKAQSVQNRAELRTVKEELRSVSHRFEDSEEKASIDAALNICEQRAADFERLEREEHDAKAREEKAIAVVRATQTSAPLETLRERAIEIRGFDLATSEARRIRDQKFSAIDREIARLEALPAELHAKVEAARDRRGLDTVRAELLSQLSRFDGARELDKLDSLLQRCEKISEVLDTLGMHRGKPLRDTADLDARKVILQRLTEQCGPYLSSVQRSLIDTTIKGIEEAAVEQQRLAVEWIGRLERDADSSKDAKGLGRLSEALSEVPPFFPDVAQQRLLTLRNKVRQQIDEDQLVQVEIAFRKIADRAMRRRCLEKLENLLEEP